MWIGSKRSFIIFFITSIFLIIIWHDTVSVNTWSVRCLKYILGNNKEAVEVTMPSSEHDLAVICMARIALLNEQPEEAILLLGTEVGNGNLTALSIQGQALEELGDYPGALKYWLLAQDYRYLLSTAKIATDQGHLEDALEIYQAFNVVKPENGIMPLTKFLVDIYKDHPAAIVVLQQGLAKYPHSSIRARWLVQLGDILRSDGNLKEAESSYQKAIKEKPNLPEAYIGLGWIQYEQGKRLDIVVKTFQFAIDNAPQQGIGYFALGQLYTRENEYKKADSLFDMALELNPNARWWYIERGNAARKTRNISQAIDVYKEALMRFPDYAPVFFELSLAYKLNDQPGEAKQTIEKAIELLVVPNILYCLRAGNIYEWTGDYTNALHAYQEALLIDPYSIKASEGVERNE